MAASARAALAFAAGASLIAASSVTGQQVRPYRPAFDVSDYSILLDLPDSGSTIRSNVVISVARVAKSDTLRLDLLDLDVQRVTVDGRTVRFQRTAEGLDVPLPARPVVASFKVSVDYGGPVKDGLIVRKDAAGRWTYFGDNWPNRGRHWIPSIDHPSDKATVTWRVLAPVTQTVVANGRLVSRRGLTATGGGQRTETIWRETRPIPVYLMVIAAAPLTEYVVGETACGLAETQRCVPQMVYTAPEQRDFMPGPFARVGEIVKLFASLAGPFPYEKLAHLQSATRFGGMENASAIFYSDAGFRNRTMADGLVAHETAHQWFGDAVTEREWAHVWLSEGFATYFAALWTRAARGDTAFRAQLAGIRRTILADSIAVTRRPVIDTIETDLMALLNRNSYEKGGFVLHMLKKQVGERAFFNGIRAYYRKHRHSTAVTNDLQAAMETASQQKLGWFFDQWLRKPGYPTVSASWKYDAATREVAVSLVQAGSFGDFRFPLTVEVVDSSGARRRGVAQIMGRSGSVQIRIPLGAPPSAVILDPDVELLAELRLVP